jgi:hypothetical protein
MPPPAARPSEPPPARPSDPPTHPGRLYNFLWGEQRVEIFVGDGQTVADARQLVAERFGSMADYVTLLYAGRQLKDATVLDHLRVPPDRHLMVYIRDMSRLFLRSVRMNDPGKDRPDNYEELLDRLIAATGNSRLTCGRCLRFYDFDYDAALEALTNLE